MEANTLQKDKKIIVFSILSETFAKEGDKLEQKNIYIYHIVVSFIDASEPIFLFSFLNHQFYHIIPIVFVFILFFLYKNMKRK